MCFTEKSAHVSHHTTELNMSYVLITKAADSLFWGLSRDRVLKHILLVNILPTLTVKNIHPNDILVKSSWWLCVCASFKSRYETLDYSLHVGKHCCTSLHHKCCAICSSTNTEVMSAPGSSTVISNFTEPCPNPHLQASRGWLLFAIKQRSGTRVWARFGSSSCGVPGGQSNKVYFRFLQTWCMQYM